MTGASLQQMSTVMTTPNVARKWSWKRLKFNKEVISGIAKLNDWTDFEEFVARLYRNNPEEPIVEMNVLRRGGSKRLREVDVLVKFRTLPENFTLGV